MLFDGGAFAAMARLFRHPGQLGRSKPAGRRLGVAGPAAQRPRSPSSPRKNLFLRFRRLRGPHLRPSLSNPPNLARLPPARSRLGSRARLGLPIDPGARHPFGQRLSFPAGRLFFLPFRPVVPSAQGPGAVRDRQFLPTRQRVPPQRGLLAPRTRAGPWTRGMGVPLGFSLPQRVHPQGVRGFGGSAAPHRRGRAFGGFRRRRFSRRRGRDPRFANQVGDPQGFLCRPIRKRTHGEGPGRVGENPSALGTIF